MPDSTIIMHSNGNLYLSECDDIPHSIKEFFRKQNLHDELQDIFDKLVKVPQEDPSNNRFYGPTKVSITLRKRGGSFVPNFGYSGHDAMYAERILADVKRPDGSRYESIECVVRECDFVKRHPDYFSHYLVSYYSTNKTEWEVNLQDPTIIVNKGKLIRIS